MTLYILYTLFTFHAFEHSLGLRGVCIQELFYLHCAVLNISRVTRIISIVVRLTGKLPETQSIVKPS